MNISPLNNSTAFEGRIIINKKYPAEFKKAFAENSEIKKLAETHDIIPKLAKKKARRGDVNHAVGEDIFQLSVKVENENPSILDKAKYFLGLAPKVDVTQGYHRMDSLLSRMEKRINADKYQSQIAK